MLGTNSCWLEPQMKREGVVLSGELEGQESSQSSAFKEEQEESAPGEEGDADISV